MKISDFASFEKLIAPSVVKIVYWIGLVFIAVSGIVGFFGAFLSGYGSTFHALLVLVGAIVGLLLWRVFCEIYIVVFGIFERLGEIRDGLTRARQGMSSGTGTPAGTGTPSGN